MKSIKTIFAALVQDEDGASMVEYGLLLAMIAIVAAGAIVGVGDSLDTHFGAISTCLANPSAGNC